eukprot:2658159-Rhodomonas_salina.4
MRRSPHAARRAIRAATRIPVLASENVVHVYQDNVCRVVSGTIVIGIPARILLVYQVAIV